MTDLFDWKYPETPGFKEQTTSKAAARRVKPRAAGDRKQVLIIYQIAWPAGLTSQEAAIKMGKNEFSVRPRVTELRKLGELTPMLDAAGNNLTRKNESGAAATVLVCKRPV